MKKIIYLFLLIIIPSIIAAPGKGSLKLIEGEKKHRLIVKFKPQSKIRADKKGKLYSLNRSNVYPASAIANNFSLSFESLLKISEEKLEEIEKKIGKGALKRGSLEEAGLGGMLIVHSEDNSNSNLLKIAEELESLESVQYCQLQGTTPPKPPFDIEPSTDNYLSEQDYLDPDPGINAKYAWSLGLSGDGVRIADIEYDWNLHHEEWNDKRVFTGGGLTPYPTEWGYKHGTAVTGIMIAGDNGYGMKGIAHGVDTFIGYPESSMEAYENGADYGWDRPFALGKSLQELKAGDIFLFEIQINLGKDENYYDKYVPGEYDKTVWDLTRALCDMGVVVVATGSNGNQNMDDYSDYMGYGDSGAIMVGAGTSDTYHDKMSYSTYGTRFNLQAWGQNVATTGSWGTTLADQWRVGNDVNQEYCRDFAGTSSAGPIVAGAAALVQEYAMKNMGKPLTSEEMRELLVETGVPQAYDDYSGHVGPIPDLKAALEKLMSESPVTVSFDGFSEDDNANNFLESGESAKINLIVKNVGSEAKSNIVVKVEALNNDKVSFPVSSQTVQSLDGEGSKSLQLEIKVEENIEDNSDLHLKFTLSGGATYSLVRKLKINGQAKLIASDIKFKEDKVNYGNIDNDLIIELVNDEFVESTDFVEGEHFTISNVPSGLTAKVTSVSKNKIKFSLEGTASPHGYSSGVKNMKLTFTEKAVKSNSVDHIENNGLIDFIVDMNDPYQIIYEELGDVTVGSEYTWKHFFFKNTVVGFGFLYHTDATLRVATYKKNCISSDPIAGEIAYVTPLNEGAMVGPEYSWKPAKGEGSDDLHIICDSYHREWWNREGYIGVEFVKEGATHYGWIKVEVNGYGESVTLKEYAYHTAPNEPIQTGQKVSIDEGGKPDKNHLLLYNYPNPFNPVTRINYTIGGALPVTPVHLLVYNASGQLVKTLVNSKQKAGSYSVKFDGSALNSGIYYYRLSTPGKTIVNKMVMIK